VAKGKMQVGSETIQALTSPEIETRAPRQTSECCRTGTLTQWGLQATIQVL